MKISCRCGSKIYDGTDDIANKAHFTPDQGWCSMWNALEEHVIDAVAAGHLTPDAASMGARKIFREAGSRLMWQCESCGRLYLDGRDGTLQCFVPSTLETDKALLRKTIVESGQYRSSPEPQNQEPSRRLGTLKSDKKLLP